MKSLLCSFLFLSAALLAAAEPELNFWFNPVKYFFHLTPEQKTELLNQVQYLSSTSSLKNLYRNDKMPLNETFMEKARNANAQTLMPSAISTSVQQVKSARAAGFKVGFAVGDLNAVVAGLTKRPDFLLLDQTQTPELIRQKLMQDLSNKVVPYTGMIDIAKKGDWVWNGESARTRTPETDLRIMSYNILACYWNHEPAVIPRVPMLKKMLEEMKPDVAGLQEVDRFWYKEAMGKLGVYRFANNGDHMSQLVYNPERVKELEGGVFQITDGVIRCVNWAKFKDIKTGKEFIVGSTHWNLRAKQREEDGRMMAKFVLRQQAAHGCPVFICGDYNSPVTETGFQTFLRETKFVDAAENAKVTENKKISSYFYLQLFTAPRANVPHIDHVTYNPQFSEALSARLILSETTLRLSDHLPLVVDYQWK